MNIEQDFERELKRGRIENLPYEDVLNRHRAILFEEFKKLDPGPKLSLYIEDGIDSREMQEINSNVPLMKSKNSFPVMASFVPLTEVEEKILDLTNQFYAMLSEKDVPDEYKGRHITQCPTVIALKEVSKLAYLLKGYVVKDDNLDNYKSFAETTANKILSILAPVDDALRTDILQILIAGNENVVLDIELWANKDLPSREMKGNYTILKNYFDIELKKGLKLQTGDIDMDPNSALQMIDEANRGTFERWEGSLSQYKESWLKGVSVEYCVAFLKYIARKKFILDKPAILKKFALERYMLDISNAIDKLNRMQNEELLEKKITTIVRIIQNRLYGKISTD